MFNAKSLEGRQLIAASFSKNYKPEAVVETAPEMAAVNIPHLPNGEARLNGTNVPLQSVRLPALPPRPPEDTTSPKSPKTPKSSRSHSGKPKRKRRRVKKPRPPPPTPPLPVESPNGSLGSFGGPTIGSLAVDLTRTGTPDSLDYIQPVYVHEPTTPVQTPLQSRRSSVQSRTLSAIRKMMERQTENSESTV